jgi:hypothetical protein
MSDWMSSASDASDEEEEKEMVAKPRSVQELERIVAAIKNTYENPRGWAEHLPENLCSSDVDFVDAQFHLRILHEHFRDTHSEVFKRAEALERARMTQREFSRDDDAEYAKFDAPTQEYAKYAHKLIFWQEQYNEAHPDQSRTIVAQQEIHTPSQPHERRYDLHPFSQVPCSAILSIPSIFLIHAQPSPLSIPAQPAQPAQPSILAQHSLPARPSRRFSVEEIEQCTMRVKEPYESGREYEIRIPKDMDDIDRNFMLAPLNLRFLRKVYGPTRIEQFKDAESFVARLIAQGFIERFSALLVAVPGKNVQGISEVSSDDQWLKFDHETRHYANTLYSCEVWHARERARGPLIPVQSAPPRSEPAGAPSAQSSTAASTKDRAKRYYKRKKCAKLALPIDPSCTKKPVGRKPKYTTEAERAEARAKASRKYRDKKSHDK